MSDSERTPARRRSATRIGDREAPKAAPVKPMAAWRVGLYRTPVLGAVASVIWPPRTKRPSPVRRIASWTSAFVAIIGIGMAAYPVAGDSYPSFYRVPVERLIEWSNFLSDMESNRIQGELEERFMAMGDPRLAGEGDPLTRLEIPSIGVDTIVVAGTTTESLKAGAGHYPSTVLPGERGNVGIAGHRTTYGRPFNKVDRLVVGDQIVLTTPVGRYTYEMTRDPWVTNPFDWGVVGPADEPLLTLTTCHPLGSARERLIVRAKLVKSEPVDGMHAVAADPVRGADEGAAAAGGLPWVPMASLAAVAIALALTYGVLRRSRSGAPAPKG